MSSKEIQIFGKPLAKMTVKDLREIAKDMPELTGVHAMKKDELIRELRELKGISEEKAVKKDATVAEMKSKIGELKGQRQAALEANDKKMARVCKRRISRLKKKTRRAVA
jgi:hypothetical protein